MREGLDRRGALGALRVRGDVDHLVADDRPDLKDTGGDATAAVELIQADGPTLRNGWDTHTFIALAQGVQAVVWGAASVIPEHCVELHRLLIDDIDLPAARALWSRIWPLCQVLEEV